MVGGEAAVRDPEIPLKLDGIARRQRHHGLEPDRGSQRDMGGGDFAEGAPDFGGAVQHQPPTHAGRGAGVNLVEKCGAEKVGAVGGCGEEAGPRIECALVVVVGVV